LGAPALHVAAWSRQFQLIRPLLEHNADPNARTASSQETALLVLSASDEGAVRATPERLQAMQDMIGFVGSDAARDLVRSVSSNGATPLLYCCRRLHQLESGIFSTGSFENELALAKLLMQCGADVYATDFFGMSPALLLKGLSRQDALEVATFPAEPGVNAQAQGCDDDRGSD